MLAILLTVILILLSVFQVALVAGAPLGEFTWGGQHKGALPFKLRMAALFSVFVYLAIAVFALSKAEVIAIIPHQPTVDIGMWVITVYLTLSILPNAISRSKPERYVMTPITLILAALSFYMAIQ